jgi:hypothetical protein
VTGRRRAGAARLQALFVDVFTHHFGYLGEGFADCCELLIKTYRYTWVKIPDDPPVPTAREGATFKGGVGHQCLCVLVARWFDAHGVPWAPDGAPETYYAGHRADVAARDGSLFVEVGSTPPTRVIDAVKAEVNLMLVPYGWRPHVGLLLEPRDRAAIAAVRAADAAACRAVVDGFEAWYDDPERENDDD